MSSALVIGGQFPTIDALKLACQEHAVADHFETRTLRANRSQYELVCKSQDCLWRIYASSIKTTSMFEIRSLHPTHTCFGLNHLGNCAATSDFVANWISVKLKEQPEYRVKDIVKDVQREFGVQITYSKAYRAKETAAAKINGSFEEAYAKLPQYCEDLKASNPDSSVVLSKAIDNKFRRLFLCFEASAAGFRTCRPLLGLDGTHLKSKYQGILLAATAVDAQGSLFPLAFGVVNSEDTENWLWFLQNLRQILIRHIPNTIEVKNELTFLSDRQKGILEGVETVFPQGAHGYCLKHLENNFHKVFKSPELKSLLWKAARASTVEEFNQVLDNMNKINAKSAPWLISHADPKYWANVYFEGRRYGHMTSNIAESLNSWLLLARELPILAMLEMIREQLMRWFSERRKTAMNSTGLLVPVVIKALQAIQLRARKHRYIHARDRLYEVKSTETFHEYLVDIDQRKCSCRIWQSQGYPCAHAVAVILGCKEDPQLYAETFFSSASYQSTYHGVILHPLSHIFDSPPDTDYLTLKRALIAEDDSDDDVSIGTNDQFDENNALQPPSTHRPVGRPKKRRIRSLNGETTIRSFKCSRCKGLGHSRRTCKDPI